MLNQKYDKDSIDSLLFRLSNISLWFFKNNKLSEEYIDFILSNEESNYYNLSKYMINMNANSNIIDSLEKQFELYKSKSSKYIDQYYDNDSLEKRYKDNLIIYNNLLNYFPEKEDNEVIDTLSSLNEKNMIDQKIPPNINRNILPNLIDKEVLDD